MLSSTDVWGTPHGGWIMAYGEDDRGVGGWLAFFLITLGVVTPALTLYSVWLTLSDPAIASAFGPSWPAFRASETILAAAVLGICWFTCWRFLTRFNWQTVRIGMVALGLLALLSVIVEPLVLATLTGIPLGMIMGAAGAELIRPIVYSTVWSLYLLRSRRVANTYGGAGSTQELGEVFH
jgi:hypothetical protein